MKNVRVNERITNYRVILILPDGTNKGEMLRAAALEMARSQGLDLVEVSPGPIPTCRAMDYGKMLYEKKKREKGHQHAPDLKEMKLKFNIGEHDLAIKTKKIKEFLEGGHKVAITMRLSGRERYVGQGTVAREKFLAIVKELNPAVNPKDVKESGSGFTYLLSPSGKAT